MSANEIANVNYAGITASLAPAPNLVIYASFGFRAVNPIVRNAQGVYDFFLETGLLWSVAPPRIEGAVLAQLHAPGANAVRTIIAAIDFTDPTQIRVSTLDIANALQDGATLSLWVHRYPTIT